MSYCVQLRNLTFHKVSVVTIIPLQSNSFPLYLVVALFPTGKKSLTYLQDQRTLDKTHKNTQAKFFSIRCQWPHLHPLNHYLTLLSLFHRSKVLPIKPYLGRDLLQL